MATEKPRKKPFPVAQIEPNPKVTQFNATMAENPNIASYAIRVDKRTGVTHLSARYVDGRVATQVELSPGLQTVIKFNPNTCSREERDRGILKLLESGLTQAEAAASMGVSQTLVSQVSRR